MAMKRRLSREVWRRSSGMSYDSVECQGSFKDTEGGPRPTLHAETPRKETASASLHLCVKTPTCALALSTVELSGIFTPSRISPSERLTITFELHDGEVQRVNLEQYH
jgi:hypothetical protein